MNRPRRQWKEWASRLRRYWNDAVGSSIFWIAGSKEHPSALLQLVRFRSFSVVIQRRCLAPSDWLCTGTGSNKTPRNSPAVSYTFSTHIATSMIRSKSATIRWPTWSTSTLNSGFPCASFQNKRSGNTCSWIDCSGLNCNPKGHLASSSITFNRYTPLETMKQDRLSSRKQPNYT